MYRSSFHIQPLRGCIGDDRLPPGFAWGYSHVASSRRKWLIPRLRLGLLTCCLFEAEVASNTTRDYNEKISYHILPAVDGGAVVQL